MDKPDRFAARLSMENTDPLCLGAYASVVPKEELEAIRDQMAVLAVVSLCRGDSTSLEEIKAFLIHITQPSVQVGDIGTELKAFLAILNCSSSWEQVDLATLCAALELMKKPSSKLAKPMNVFPICLEAKKNANERIKQDTLNEAYYSRLQSMVDTKKDWQFHAPCEDCRRLPAEGPGREPAQGSDWATEKEPGG